MICRSFACLLTYCDLVLNESEAVTIYGLDSYPGIYEVRAKVAGWIVDIRSQADELAGYVSIY